MPHPITSKSLNIKRLTAINITQMNTQVLNLISQRFRIGHGMINPA